MICLFDAEHMIKLIEVDYVQLLRPDMISVSYHNLLTSGVLYLITAQTLCSPFDSLLC